MHDIIALCPIYSNLPLAEKSIRSLTDLGIKVIGVTDGPITFDYKIDNFSLEVRSKMGVHMNGFERIKVGCDSNSPWVYLFDSDSIHLPSCIDGFTKLKARLKDGEIGSLYITPYHPSTGTGGELRTQAKVPGISMFFNHNTAVLLKAFENIFINNSARERHWDNYLGSNSKCFTTTQSYCEHLGNLQGIHAGYRRTLKKNDVAQDINTQELQDTLKKYGLHQMKYKF